MGSREIVLLVLGVIVTVAAALLSGTYVAFRCTLTRRKVSSKQTFPEEFSPYLQLFEQGREEFLQSDHEKLTLTAPDGVRLCGYFRKADVPSARTAVLLHGYHGRSSDRMADSEIFRSLGYNVFLPDLRSHGESGGKYVGMGVKDRKDIYLWISLLTEKLGKESVFILSGVSMGGATVAALSGDSDLPEQVKAVISDCPYTSVYDEFSYLLRSTPRFCRSMLVGLTEKWCKVLAKYDFRTDTPLMQVKKSRTPTLFIHGKADDFVPYDFGKRLYDACSAPKQMVTVEGAGHGLAFFVDKDKVVAEIKNFLQRYAD